MEQFLFSMLGDAFELDMGVVRGVVLSVVGFLGVILPMALLEVDYEMALEYATQSGVNEEPREDIYIQSLEADHKYMAILWKKWVDDQSRHHSFMIYPRALFITWGNCEHWDWKCFKETSEENIEVAKLSHVCWLDVRGKFKMSELTEGVKYQIFYELKLSKAASGLLSPFLVFYSYDAVEYVMIFMVYDV